MARSFPPCATYPLAGKSIENSEYRCHYHYRFYYFVTTQAAVSIYGGQQIADSLSGKPATAKASPG